MNPSQPLLPRANQWCVQRKFGDSRILPEGVDAESQVSKTSSTVSYPSPSPWFRYRLGWLCRSRPLRTKHASLWIVIKTIASLLVLFSFLSIWNTISSPSYATPPQHYLDLEQRVRSSVRPGRANVNNEKIFIAANIVNEDLIRGVWGENLVSLIDLLGPENVFVSVYENDSGNGTSQALRELQRRIPCKSSIVTGEKVSLSSFSKTRLPNGEERIPRLMYLAEIRNRLLRPLDPSYDLSSTSGFQKATDIQFDKILFLNDVYYSPLEAAQLLFSTNTNASSGRAEYRAACAIDFVQFFKLYDTFVVRDTDGYSLPLQFFPWFTHRGSGASRDDVLSVTDAVQVRSCWGGMAAFDARVFQQPPPPTITPTNSDVTNNSHPALVPTPVLKFRSTNEPFWESSECCLIFADMEYLNTSTSSSAVYINPFIRTAYSPLTYRHLQLFKRIERLTEYYHHIVDLLKPPEHNPRRTHEPGDPVEDLVWQSDKNSYELQRRIAAPGGLCGERRMFVMKSDLETANRKSGGKNWESVPVPWRWPWRFTTRV